MTTIIILTFLFILGLGFRIIRKRLVRYIEDAEFAIEYRNTFVQFANTYMANYDTWNRVGKIDNEKYTWLTKNVDKMQSNLGAHGRMFYVAPFQIYQISNYQIVINSLPKFKEGSAKDFDINSVDDCLTRYIGAMENVIKTVEKKLRNPVIWFREGFQELISFPVYLLNWFGLLSENGVFKVTSNGLYRIITGIGGLVAFTSGAVTIIQGKQAVVDFIKEIFH